MTRLEVEYFFRVLKGAVILEDASIHAVEEWSKLREVKKEKDSLLETLLPSLVS